MSAARKGRQALMAIRTRYAEWHDERGEEVLAPDHWDADPGETMEHYIVRNDVPAMVAALTRIGYLDETDPELQGNGDMYYFDGVVDALAHVREIVADSLDPKWRRL